jgi:hypothetical protein
MGTTYRAKDVLTYKATIPQTTANLAVTSAFPITAHGSKCLRIDVEYSTAVAATGITAFLQHSNDGVNWEAPSVAQSVAITTATATHTVKSILFNADLTGGGSDSEAAPLRTVGRILVTTQAGDSVTLTACKVCQDW